MARKKTKVRRTGGVLKKAWSAVRGKTRQINKLESRLKTLRRKRMSAFKQKLRKLKKSR